MKIPWACVNHRPYFRQQKKTFKKTMWKLKVLKWLKLISGLLSTKINYQHRKYSHSGCYQDGRFVNQLDLKGHMHMWRIISKPCPDYFTHPSVFYNLQYMSKRSAFRTAQGCLWNKSSQKALKGQIVGNNKISGEKEERERREKDSTVNS